MTYAQVTKNGETFWLIKQPNSDWYFTDVNPFNVNETPILVTVEVEDDFTVEISVDDENLAYALLHLFVDNQSFYGYKMINYYPIAINSLLEFKALIHALGFEIDYLKCQFRFSYDDFFLQTMGENRVKEWENILQIVPPDGMSLDERRRIIIARLQSRFKLNTESINRIVNTLTGGRAYSRVINSNLYVIIYTQSGDKNTTFPAVEAELLRRIPAHIGLGIDRYYGTWGQIKSDFTSWQDVYATFPTWDDVKFYISDKVVIPTN
jgi:hypothetical protein